MEKLKIELSVKDVTDILKDRVGQNEFINLNKKQWN